MLRDGATLEPGHKQGMLSRLSVLLNICCVNGSQNNVDNDTDKAPSAFMSHVRVAKEVWKSARLRNDRVAQLATRCDFRVFCLLFWRHSFSYSLQLMTGASNIYEHLKNVIVNFNGACTKCTHAVMVRE